MFWATHVYSVLVYFGSKSLCLYNTLFKYFAYRYIYLLYSVDLNEIYQKGL